MTIRLIDVESQRRFRGEVEDYERALRERRESGDLSGPWPSFPQPPEPLVDSRDADAASSPFSLGGLASYGGLQDGGIPAPHSLDRDGTSSKAPEGWESGWQDNKGPKGHDHRTTPPFKSKK
jgi:hypothetical protein